MNGASRYEVAESPSVWIAPAKVVVPVPEKIGVPVIVRFAMFAVPVA